LCIAVRHAPVGQTITMYGFSAGCTDDADVVFLKNYAPATP
jgi:hypothetical protein